MKDYDRNSSYRLPVKPSPNIPNEKAVLLYPGMGLFEGTVMSLGRGTDFPFQTIGHPEFPVKTFSFIPRPSSLSKEPKYFNQICYGIDLRNEKYLVNHPGKLNLTWIIDAYANLPREDFFDENFNYHSGNTELQQQLRSQLPEEEIRRSWEADLDNFKSVRKKYLLYPDFTQ